MTNTGSNLDDPQTDVHISVRDESDAVPLFHTDPVIEEGQFRLLAEDMPILCWIANPDGYIFWYNRRWHEYCGSTPETMAGWGWKTVHDPKVLPTVLEKWTGCIAVGEPFEMIFPLRGADGVYHPFLTRVRPHRDTNGAIRWWFGVNMDVTDQFAAEAELRASTLKCEAIAAEREAILGQLDEGVIVTDPTGKITFVNAAASKLHGVTRLDIEPENYTKAYHLLTEDGDPHPVDSLPLSRAVRDHEIVVDARWRIRRPDGSEVLAMGNAKPVYAEDKSLIGAVLTIRDDTNRHAAEEAMAQAVEFKDILLQEVNHRVKNSLQLVTSLLSLQADKTALSEVKESLLEARLRIGVVAGMHQRLYKTIQHNSVDLPSYLRELAAETIVALDAERRINLQFHADDDLAVSLDDAIPLALVVNELLTNAMKYAFAGRDRGTISIKLLRTETELLLIHSDNGTGLPDDFDPLASTGLGMLIVMALVAQVNGKLTVKPQDQGTAFVITLPADRLFQKL